MKLPPPENPNDREVLVATAIHTHRTLAYDVDQHAALFNTLPDGIVVMDELGIVERINSMIETLFGHSKHDLVGQSVGVLLSPDDAFKLTADNSSFWDNQTSQLFETSFECEGCHSDGSKFPIELTIREWAYKNGRQFFGYIRDVTEKKAKAVELLEAKARAGVANRAKTNFLSMMNHEIRTPLNGVLGALTLLSESVNQPENKMLLETAHQSGKSLLAMINDVLDFSNLEAGKFDLDIGSFRAELLVDGEQSLVHQQATEKTLKLDGIRLLLAEDNGTNQLVVGTMLKRFGCVVDMVANGQEAIDGIKERDYDAVLMDISMPEMDGITATKIIRSMDGAKGKIPIIALTAFALDEDRQRVLAAGMNDFVAKPVSRIELARAIARHVTTTVGESKPTSPALSSSQMLFDDEILNGILTEMDDATSTKILVELNKDIRRHLSSMKQSVVSADAEAFERATHGLKGVSGTFGATGLSRISSQANNRVRNCKTKAAFDMAAEIDAFALATLRSVDQRFRNSNLRQESSSI